MNITSKQKLVAGIAMATVAVTFGVAFAYAGKDVTKGPDGKLAAAVMEAFPNTKVSSVDCGNGPKGLCEVVAGRNVFYASRDGRYIVIGQVIDLKDKVDITNRRLQELAAVANVEDKLSGLGNGQGAAPTQAPVAPQAPAGGPTAAVGGAVINVTLPKSNAVIHNPGGALKLTVFADYSCGYCHKLFEELKGRKDIEITEYPIAILGPESEAKAKRVLCSDDRVSAANALYYGGEMKTAGECAAGSKQLQENLQFARDHGISGTPMLIRTDGATNSGYLPVAEVERWLRLAKA